MKVVLAAAFVALVVVASIAGSWALSLHSLHRSQHQWCSALVLLTKHPVPPPVDPKANPSRVATYEFYISLVNLEHSFGCSR